MELSPVPFVCVELSPVPFVCRVELSPGPFVCPLFVQPIGRRAVIAGQLPHRSQMLHLRPLAETAQWKVTSHCLS